MLSGTPALIINNRNLPLTANQKLAYFTMETSALTEILPIQTLEIRPITVISNTLNNFNAIYKLKHSPLKNLVINPVSEEVTSQHVPEMSTYKGYVSKLIEFVLTLII